MQDMMHCLNPSLLQRQRFHLQQQHQQPQQQPEMTINNFSTENFYSLPIDDFGGEVWPQCDMRRQPHQLQQELPAPSPSTTSTTLTSATVSNSASSTVGKQNCATISKKRKSSLSVECEDEEKRMKREQGSEGEKQLVNKREDSGNSSKENADKKPDYIHVRARRGQATDSHSLAERVRRERISERMKYLQGLVPGCSKITGKAGMLDEIINYVQSLQRQVEFLSMKLAAVSPRLDLDMEALLSKEVSLSCNSNISTVVISPEMVDLPSFLQFSSLNVAMNPPADLGLRAGINAAMPLSAPFPDSCFNAQRTNGDWDSEFHNPYGQVPLNSLQGLPNNMKTEM